MFNWREVPFIRLILPFILGIVTATFLDDFFSAFTYLLFILFLYITYSIFWKIKFKWRYLNGFLFNIFFFLLGIQLSFFQNEWHHQKHFRQYLNSENIILGIVDNPPSHKERSIQVVLNTKQIGKDYSSLNSCFGKIVIWMRNDSSSQKIEYGDLLLLKASPKLIAEPLNPNAFNFKKYLAGKNIHYQFFSETKKWEILQKNRGNSILSYAYKARSSLIKILKKYLGSKEEFAVASALIVGYKEALSDELRNAYSSTGAMHVLAVSGLHVGLIWGIIAFFLKFVKWRHPAWNWIKTSITIIFLWSFALLTGASPSVLRAATMFSFVLIGIALNRNTNIYNTLAASAFCLLLFNPFLLFEIGFQLSYLAVLGIVYWYRKIYSLWYIKNKTGDYLWKLSAVAIAAQLSTFPLSMYYFQQFPIYFLLSGIIVVPFAFLILGTGLSLFFTEYLIPFLSTLLAKILFGILWLMNALIFLIEQLPAESFKNIWISTEVLCLLFLFIGFVISAINFRNIKFLLAALGVLILIGGIDAVSILEKSKQKKLVIYHFSGKTLIDLIDDRNLYRIKEENIRTKNINFATENFIIKNRIKKRYEYLLNEKNENNSFYLNAPFLQFDKLKIAFPKKMPKSKPASKIKVDYVLIREKSNYSIDELSTYFDFKEIVFDGNLSFTKRMKYKDECETANIKFYDVNVQGALVINL